MSEKTIHEVKVVETEDGFRIEVKGDKEAIRKMGFGRGMGFGPRMGFGPHRFHGRRGWKRGFRHGFGRGFGPPWYAGEAPEDDAPQANV